MASLIISSAAVTALSRATPSQTRKVLVAPMNGNIKLSNSSVSQTHASLVAPFTGLKSTCKFPLTKKLNYINTSFTSNGGRARCMATAVAVNGATPDILLRKTAAQTVDSLWSTATEGKELQYEDKMSIVGQIGARDLSITWGSDPRYWKWTSMEIGGVPTDVAELVIVWWFLISGKYNVEKLTDGMNYQVRILVKLLDNFNINTPTTLSLTTPDGLNQEHTVNMIGMPKNQIIAITAGIFQAQKASGGGEINFLLRNLDSFAKRGLVVIGALVEPIF